MKIHLIRHAKPDVKNKFLVNSRELQQWVTNYNNSDIILNEKKILYIKNKLNPNVLFISSTLVRAIKTAESIESGKSILTDSNFCEAALPILNLRKITLPLPLWLVILRLLWIFKFPFKGESYKETGKRAQTAASKLEDMANEYNEIALFGHGFFNRLIIRALVKNKWKLVGKKDMSHLGFSTLLK